MVEATPTRISDTASELSKSKYAMLEIFKYFQKQEAILLMRQLNRRFYALTKDPYLDNFVGGRDGDQMHFRIDRQTDLKIFQRLVKFSKMLGCSDCLVVDFYYDFGYYKRIEKMDASQLADKIREWDRVAEVLAEAPQYKMLAIGSDGLNSLMLPKIFLKQLFTRFAEKQTLIGMLELDLHWLQGSHFDDERFESALPISEDSMADISELVATNPGLNGLIFVHTKMKLAQTAQLMLAFTKQNKLMFEKHESSDKKQGTRRLAFQNVIIEDDDAISKFFGAPIEMQVQAVGQIEALEFRLCHFPSMDFKQLITNNITLKKLVIENTIQKGDPTPLSQLPNYPQALLDSEGRSNLRHIQWVPPFDSNIHPNSAFWKSFFEVLQKCDRRFSTEESEPAATYLCRDRLQRLRSQGQESESVSTCLCLERLDLNDFQRNLQSTIDDIAAAYVPQRKTGLSVAEKKNLVQSYLVNTSKSITTFRYVNEQPTYLQYAQQDLRKYQQSLMRAVKRDKEEEESKQKVDDMQNFDGLAMEDVQTLNEAPGQVHALPWVETVNQSTQDLSHKK